MKMVSPRLVEPAGPMPFLCGGAVVLGQPMECRVGHSLVVFAPGAGARDCLRVAASARDTSCWRSDGVDLPILAASGVWGRVRTLM